MLYSAVPLAAGCASWLLSSDTGTVTKIQVYWLTQVLLTLAFGVLCLRVAAVTHRAAHRFWAALGGAALVWTAGCLVQAVTVLVDPATAAVNGGTAYTVCFSVGNAAIIVVMLLHPSVARSGRQRLAHWLDTATALTGGAALAWAFLINPRTVSSSDLVSALVTTGMLLASLYAVVNMLLSGVAPLTCRAAAPLIAAAAFFGLGEFAIRPGDDTDVHPGLLVLRLVPSFLLIAGPRLQELQARTDPGMLTSDRRKPYSSLPYASIGCVFVALVAILPDGVNARLWGVVSGLAVVTALVLARQLVTSRDNVDLIGRLDRTLIDLRAHQRLLLQQTSFDELTGLANRGTFVKQIDAALAGTTDNPAPSGASHDPAPSGAAHDLAPSGAADDLAPSGAADGAGLALLLIDLDDFKTINDTLGYATGDALLVEAAGLLRASLPTTARVARTGGDEFAVLLRDPSAEQPTQVATQILANLGRPIRVDQHELLVGASVGVAVAAPGDDADSLLRNADIAMHEAKEHGKGGYLRYAPEMAARVSLTARLAYHLHEAIGTDQFFLLYQPIVRLADGRMTGVESLLRWRHPRLGPMSPAEFIPVAENTGMIVQIGRWVLREACRQAAAWRTEYPETEQLVVNVNVAGRQLREPGFVDDVAATLADFDLPPANLTIEITENAVLSDEAAIAPLHELRELGVRLALDDFGTGASSLGLLLTCPVTTLKLDRSFVDKITTVSRQAAVATAVIEMANALGLAAVAEGIETPEQAARLRELSYEYAQGFLFARPLSADELAGRWIRGWATARAA